jgi:hypothetical protein
VHLRKKAELRSYNPESLQHVWLMQVSLNDDRCLELPAKGEAACCRSADRPGGQRRSGSATVRKFCDVCNHGWMGGIEGMAKPIVGPMVQGTPTTLDAAAQQAVASWAVLKGLVAAQVSTTPQPIPESHYRRVHHFGGAPPNTMRVWIGRRWNLANPNRTDRAQLFDAHFMPITNAFAEDPLPADLETYRRECGMFNATTFQVGHFFALTLQHDWPGLHARANPDTEAADALLPIWPTGPTVHWPPRGPIDELGDPHKVTRFLQMAPPVVPVYGA